MAQWRIKLDSLPLQESAEIARTICKGVTVQDVSKWRKPEYYGSEPVIAIKNALHAPRVRRHRIGHRIEATLAEVEIERLQTILDYYGETKTELVKRLINEEYERMDMFQRLIERRLEK